MAAIGGLNLSTGSDEDDGNVKNENPVLSAAVVAAASRSFLRPPSLQTLLEGVPDAVAVHHTSSSGGDSDGKNRFADKSSRSRKLKHDVIEAVNELIQDITTCHEQIAGHAVEHIHQNEVIFTLGRSRRVMEFLCATKEKKISFRVFVAEGAPRALLHFLDQENFRKEMILSKMTRILVPLINFEVVQLKQWIDLRRVLRIFP